MLDQTDFEILSLLTKNARIQWREIGELVHLTGQAVANRIRKMEEDGIIEGYSVKVNEAKMEKSLIAFVIISMKNKEHFVFRKFVKEAEHILEANRISGDGCYLLKIKASTQDELMKYLDEILKYGDYRVNVSIGKIK